MNRRFKIRSGKIWKRLSRELIHRENGAELLELALTLPFLLVMVAGVIDFGGAWSLKDQLTNAARDGARTAVADFNDTTNPQCGGTPCSVQAAANAVVTSLNNGKINTCGLNPTTDAPAAGTFTWTYTAACANPVTIVIEREVPNTVDGTTTLSTRVTVSYPYNWDFANVAGLLGGANTFSNTITLTSAEIMTNLN